MESAKNILIFIVTFISLRYLNYQEVMKMECDKMLEKICDFVDEDVDSSFCQEFREHLQNCDKCRIMVDTVKKTITLYREEDNQACEIPEGFHNRLHKALKDNWKLQHPPENNSD